MLLIILLKISSKEKYLIVIAGPTAVGKTDISIKLASHYSSVILSADSRQFYQEINIGTAKPDKDQLMTVPHYFISTKRINELYGAGHYEKDAIALLNELFKTHQVIFMVGGSGLYIDAVLNGVDDFMESMPEIREGLNKEFSNKGIEWLQDELKQHDSNYFEIVDKQNPQRMIRALEVFRQTGQPYSVFLKRNRTERNFTPIKIFINESRESLYKKINSRVDLMMKQGLLDEVKGLKIYRNSNALKTVGYRELFEYLEGKHDLKAAVEKIKQHTRNYAKRQITWFKNKDSFEEFAPHELDKIKAFIDIITQNG